MRRIVLALALTSAALAAPAFAASVDSAHLSNMGSTTVAVNGDTTDFVVLNNAIDQTAAGVNVDHRNAATSIGSLDAASYSFGCDYVYVAPVVLSDRQASSFITANASLPVVMQYAVVIKVGSTNDPFGVDLDLASRAKHIA